MTELPPINDSDIAIIGMACRFPGATTIDDFWRNLKEGIESISFFSDEELIASGIEPATFQQPNYVKAGGVLSDIERFDAAFFDFSPREAEITDPQHRIFLECAWEALESAGYAAPNSDNVVGVYAGVGMNTYLLNNLHPNRGALTDHYSLIIGNDKDFLPTRVSYKLDLKGPSINIQTACSTSLVAVHLACQGLLNGECDMALAGGVSVRVPHQDGYLYQEGMIYSPDGHCRAFDARAKGTVGGNGAGIVVLKRLEQAIADGDPIHAVIKGSAVNNDGALKVGYTAPGVAGQAAVIAEAQAMAAVEAETIRYIETHGTGTGLGDPIEIAALTRAFRETTEKNGFCAIGALKANIGHTDAAAGVAGLIKTVLALKNRRIPPSLHFETPNPEIDFADSPFYVNATLADWKADGTPRRAGVSSFGIGGTNAHVIVEEAPESEPSGKSRPRQLLLLSARTDSALETATANLATYLEQQKNPHQIPERHGIPERHRGRSLPDVAYTLSLGRKEFDHRRVVVCREIDEAKDALRSLDPTRLLTGFRNNKSAVVFMFSGQGTQYVHMGRELYETEPVFREAVDRCAEYLEPRLGRDLRRILYPRHPEPTADETIRQTAITQPALFVIEYALAKLWMSWGVHPEAMIGHSIGEYVAACLAGVFSLEDALSLVAARGRMMQSMPTGEMLAVPLPADEIPMNPGLSLAAINAPGLCVVSGPAEAVSTLETQLSRQGVQCRRLHTSHAFHSELMEPILAPFTERVAQIDLAVPRIPYLSNVTGTWITAEDATDPGYWARHLRQTVRFADGVRELVQDPSRILLEVGPGQTLTTLAKRHPDKAREQVVLSSLRPPEKQQSDAAFLLNTLGRLWLAGGEIDWSGFYVDQDRHRLPLPTYPFERQRYWVDPPAKTAGTPKDSATPRSLTKKPDIADWFYVPDWKPSVLPAARREDPGPWLIFADACGLGLQLAKELRRQGQAVVTVKIGSAFTGRGDNDYSLNPRLDSDYEALIEELRDRMPRTIVHLWCVTQNGCRTIEEVDGAQESGFYSLLFLVQALGKQNITNEIQIAMISNTMQAVTGEEELHPEQATVLGPVKIIGQEYPNLACRSIDLALPSSGTDIEPALIGRLSAELGSKSSDQVIAYRGAHRWVQGFEPVRLEQPVAGIPRLRDRGVYLITGGLGGIGLTLAEHLAKTVQAKLILTGRSAFPARDKWGKWLVNHDAQDSVGKKIRQIEEMESLGAEVLVASADVTNLGQMQDVITEAQQRFGWINGVIHSAGLADHEGIIQKRTRESIERIMGPKVIGTLALEYLLKDAELDFFVLFSSISTVLYGTKFGQVGYNAGCEFQNAFAHYKSSQENTALTITINWDDWKEVGMSVEGLKKWKQKRWLSAEAKQLDISPGLLSFEGIGGLLPSEGMAVFERILNNPNPQVLVSTQDLQSRLEQSDVTNLLNSLKATEPERLPKHSRPRLGHPYVAPRNELEEKLAASWQRFLGIDQIGIHDDFFELGGDSLAAVQLIAGLRETLQIDLSAQSLLNASTIAALADSIEKTTSTSSRQPARRTSPSLLVEFNVGNHMKPPLFLIHPVGGHVYFYRELASHLDREQPVYGIRAQGVDGETEPLTRVEEMATRYIEVMRARRPEGPYFLGGSSFGGTVAFEMARQLHVLDEKVALLTMVDTPGPGQMPASLETDGEILAYLLTVGANVQVNSDELQRLEPDEQLRYFLEQQKKTGKEMPPDSDIANIRHFLHIFKVNSKAMGKYQPQAYPGKIIFFRAMEKDAVNAKNPERAWVDLAQGGLEVIDVPGNHITMNESPNIQVIADRLKMHLE